MAPSLDDGRGMASEDPRRGIQFVSPSRVARYFFHECDRFLRYSSTPRADRPLQGIPTTGYETRPVTRAILETGYAWEERVIADHLRARAAIAPGDGAVRDRVEYHRLRAGCIVSVLDKLVGERGVADKVAKGRVDETEVVVTSGQVLRLLLDQQTTHLRGARSLRVEPQCDTSAGADSCATGSREFGLSGR